MAKLLGRTQYRLVPRRPDDQPQTPPWHRVSTPDSPVPRRARSVPTDRPQRSSDPGRRDRRHLNRATHRDRSRESERLRRSPGAAAPSGRRGARPIPLSLFHVKHRCCTWGSRLANCHRAPCQSRPSPQAVCGVRRNPTGNPVRDPTPHERRAASLRPTGALGHGARPSGCPRHPDRARERPEIRPRGEADRPSGSPLPPATRLH